LDEESSIQRVTFHNVPKRIRKMLRGKMLRIIVEVVEDEKKHIIPIIYHILVSVSCTFGLSAAQSESEPGIIPVRVTLLVPGSLTDVFPWTDNVTASASSAKHSDYTFLTRQNYVVFTTNASDTFKIKIIVSYPAFKLYEFTVRAYSHNALSDYLVTFTLNCLVIVFDIDLTTTPAPRYPTAEEIAELKADMWLVFSNP